MALPETKPFHFKPPPDCPVYRPSPEEFKDPLGYISKIRPVAEAAGLCKIIPPEGWAPPFAVDVSNFKFTPRIQRLNELEATTRIKLNFLDQIAKFWSLQGSTLKLPTVEKKALDLYSLFQIVESLGGFEVVCRDRRWSNVAQMMGYPAHKHVGSLLRPHYARILYPYELFKKGKTLEAAKNVKTETPTEDVKPDMKSVNGRKDIQGKDGKTYIPHSIPQRQAVKPPVERYSRRSKRGTSASASTDGNCEEGSPLLTLVIIIPTPSLLTLLPSPMNTQCESDEEPDVLLHVFRDSQDAGASRELQRLKFYGAGPKLSGLPDDDPVAVEYRSKVQEDPLAKYICRHCNRGDAEDQMLICDGCDESYHTFCLMPPLTEIPKGDWRCPSCVAEQVNQTDMAFGFEQAQKEYTLQSFGEMADRFKREYFGLEPHKVPVEVVEQEFWRIVSSIDEDVTVEYGADLHTMDHGSGFPTPKSANLDEIEKEYANAPWNLNNLPILDDSVLTYINTDISGMMVPWMYVGMCFSAFCWHNEDHWSYSINYMHWGEPKTWYGVPGGEAETFEAAMKSYAGELFETQPDLLHQLVTIMNPNLLQAKGVPIVRCMQRAGEFVITFPRSYHGGFNQGYNFAEAVNFSPSDWLPMGRECITHYSNLHRFCVFSHDELVCTMASNAEKLSIQVAAAVFSDMVTMVDQEKRARKSVLEWGVTRAEREAFELLEDDKRICDFCKTTLFLSGMACSCCSKLVCLNHSKLLCDCEPGKHILRYRFTLDELKSQLRSLKTVAESFDKWLKRVEDSLSADDDDRLSLAELRELLKEATDRKYPETENLRLLKLAIQEAEKTSFVAEKLVAPRVRTRGRTSVPGGRGSESGPLSGRENRAARRTAAALAAAEREEASACVLSLEELKLLVEQVQNMKCKINEAELLISMYETVTGIEKEARQLLKDESPSVEDMDSVIERGLSYEVEVPSLSELRRKRDLQTWMEDCEEILADQSGLSVEALQNHLTAALSLPPTEEIEATRAALQQMINKSQEMNGRTQALLAKKQGAMFTELDMLINQINSLPMPTNVPSMNLARDIHRRSTDLIARVKHILEDPPLGEGRAYLETAEGFHAKSKQIPITLDVVVPTQVKVVFRWAQRERILNEREKTVVVYPVLIFDALEREIQQAKNWLEVAREKFRRKTSPYTLLECLSPRREVPLCKEQIKRAKIVRDPEFSTQQTQMKLLGMKSPGGWEDVRRAYKAIYRREIRDMYHLRMRNKLKSQALIFGEIPSPLSEEFSGDEVQDKEFCYCGRPQDESLLLPCELCREHYHVSCVPLPRPAKTIKAGSRANGTYKDQKFICPLCARSKRPDVDDCLQLLVGLQKILIRLPEAEALQCLVERAMDWQERARAVLNSRELAKTVERLDPDYFARMKEHMRVIGKTEQQEMRKLLDAEKERLLQDKEEEEETEPTKTNDIDLTCSETAPPGSPEISLVGETPTPRPGASEHAYSSISRSNANNGPPKPSLRPDPYLKGDNMDIDVRRAAGTGLREEIEEFLERLLMEGHLIEFKLDETHVLWSILQEWRLPSNVHVLPDYSRLERALLEHRAARMEAAKRSSVREDVIEKKSRHGSGSSVGSTIVQSKKRTRLSRSNSLVGSGSPGNGGNPPPKRAKGSAPKRRMRKSSTAAASGSGGAVTSDDVTELIEEDEDCEAVPCMKPTGSVDWIQCDGCSKWLHMKCIGLSKLNVKDNEDYICTMCRPLPQAAVQGEGEGVTRGEHSLTSVNQASTNQIHCGAVLDNLA
ncbi:unnamed protein product [Cyprideis torosa]|uniref:[histone H3]-trimethyl-L-lysine(4) demethylase n=1 Tax=Cyprideis torosa TaxID=163714 RepID=A0A7R8ZT83_9CRUS|nr:unnamed protein product [Cyprideis torosa]CAG0897430.1 unnamed protein product [Cyprideis torosa]